MISLLIPGSSRGGRREGTRRAASSDAVAPKSSIHPGGRARRRRTPGARLAWLPALASTLLACTAPGPGFDRAADGLGFTRTVVDGAGGYRHAVFRRPVPAAGPRLNVYLGGDGTPWLDRTRVAADPTPRDPVALRLMALDPGPAVLLGRPCYHGIGGPRCTPWTWTHGRYSAAVVASLAAAVRRILAGARAREAALVGYSGGGTLAMLVAARLPEVRAVVTVAANLDVAAWAEHHRFSPLSGSLSPASEPPLPARVVQVHYVGARDRNVPPRLVAPVAARQSGARVVTVAGHDHRCCWEDSWAEVLADLRARLGKPGGG